MPIPSSHRLRKGRVSIPGQLYLLTTTTLHRQPVFHDFHLARTVIARLREAHESNHVQSLAWVLMPDHLHWLIELNAATLEQVMQQFKYRSSYLVNGASARAGPLWQRGFHDRALRHEEDVPSVARYIVANPIRAGLVTSVRQYPHWDAVWL